MTTTTVYLENLVCDQSIDCPNMTLNGSPVLSENSSSVLSNKTIDSANNTITITNSPLVATNINQLVNQDIRTTASPQFVNETITNRLTIDGSNRTSILIYNDSLTNLSNDIQFFHRNDKVFGAFAIGTNPSTEEAYVWVYKNMPLKIATNGVERIRIPASGIINDNTNTQLLTLDGTTLKYRTVSSLPVVNPFDQNLNTTNSPQFYNLTLTSPTQSSLTMNNGYIQYNNSTITVREASDYGTYPNSGLVRDFIMYGNVPATNLDVIIFSYTLIPNYSACIDFMFTATAGDNQYGCYHYTYSVMRTLAGAQLSGTLYSDKKETGAPYGGKLTITGNVVGNIFQLLMKNSGATQIRVSGRCKIDLVTYV